MVGTKTPEGTRVAENTSPANRLVTQSSSSSAGIASPSQFFMGTSSGAVVLDNGLTSAPRPWKVELEIVFPLLDVPHVQAPEPTFKLERKWRRMAATERKKASKRGLRPSDVEKEIGALRYHR